MGEGVLKRDDDNARADDHRYDDHNHDVFTILGWGAASGPSRHIQNALRSR